MMDKPGIEGLLDHQPTLENRLKAHLSLVPSDASLKDEYVDPGDRQRVRRRALIAATLDAIFEHQFADMADGGYAEVGNEPDVFSDLADARRDFLHDAELLNNGAAAKLVLKTTKTDDALSAKPLKAERKELIVWLVLAYLSRDDGEKGLPSQTSVFEMAAKATVRKPDSFRTELSKITCQKSPQKSEQIHFFNLVSSVEQLADLSGINAFYLLRPAARALSEAAIRKPRSANSTS